MNNLHQSYSRQQGSQEEQVIYDYFLQHIRTDTPGQLVEDFRRLFIEGRGFRDIEVYTALGDFQEKVSHPFSESVCRTSQISEKGKIKSCSRILSANKNLPI